jgi:hypothetical protein
MLKNTMFAALLIFVSHNVLADDKPLEFQLLSAADKVQDSKDIKIVVKDQKNGVFVLAAGGWSGKYPNTTKLVRDMMVAKGIKVTDDPANADVGLQFTNIAGFSLDDVETQSNHLDGGKIAGGVGAVLGGGIFGLAGMMGSNADKPAFALFMTIAVDKPTITGRNKIDGENRRAVNSELRYQANKTGAEVSTAAFVAYVDDFINKHFVIDGPAVVPVAGSAPVAVSGVSADALPTAKSTSSAAPAATLVSSKVK